MPTFGGSNVLKALKLEVDVDSAVFGCRNVGDWWSIEDGMIDRVWSNVVWLLLLVTRKSVLATLARRIDVSGCGNIWYSGIPTADTSIDGIVRGAVISERRIGLVRDDAWATWLVKGTNTTKSVSLWFVGWTKIFIFILLPQDKGGPIGLLSLKHKESIVAQKFYKKT